MSPVAVEGSADRIGRGSIPAAHVIVGPRGSPPPAPPFGRCRSTRPAATLGSVRVEPAAPFPLREPPTSPDGKQPRIEAGTMTDKNGYADGLRDRASTTSREEHTDDLCDRRSS
jgi:hypothetical protein